MVNSLLLRIHQSGHLVNLSQERLNLVREGIHYYKQIRQDIKVALPYWPIGLSQYGDPWVCLGLKSSHADYIAVWRRNSQSDILSIPIQHLKGKEVNVVCGYPANEPCKYQWNKASGELTVQLPSAVSARLFTLA